MKPSHRRTRAGDWILYGAALFTGAMVVVSAALVLVDRLGRPPLELTVSYGSRPGEVILEWSGGPAGVDDWQFHVGALPSDEDAQWRDVPRGHVGPLKRTDETTLRLLGVLPTDRRSYVSIRPRGGYLEAGQYVGVPVAGSDGIVRASFGRLEGGGEYRLHTTEYLFKVPDRGEWSVFAILDDYANVIRVAEEETGAYAWLDLRTATEATWWATGWWYGYEGGAYRARARTRAPAERAAYRLMEELLASIRYQPEPPDPAIRAINGGAVGEILIEWAPVQDATHWEYRVGEQSRTGADSNTDNISWREWKELPARTDRLRIFLGSQSARWRVEVRPRMVQGPGPSRGLWVQTAAPPAGGFPALQDGALHAGANRYRLGNYVLDVPVAMLLRMQQYVLGLPAVPPPAAGAARLPLQVSRDPVVAGSSTSGGRAHDLANPAYRTLLMDEASGSFVVLDRTTHEVLERRARPHPHGVDTGSMLDEMLGSMRYSPIELATPLLALAGGQAGEIVLRFVPDSLRATHWQYRMRKLAQEPGVPPSGAWSAWAELPRGAAAATSHRIEGLGAGLAFEFEARSVTAGVPGDVHRTRIDVPQVGRSGVPLVRGLVEGGQTFQHAHSSLVFDVPSGMLVHVETPDHPGYDVGELHLSMVIRDIGSGSLLWVSPSGNEQRRWIPTHAAGTDVGDLFDQIIDSLRSGAAPLSAR